MDDVRLLDAADAYEDERARWGVRRVTVQACSRYEIYRSDDDDVPIVMASTTGGDTAENEEREMSAIAGMKAALAELEK